MRPIVQRLSQGIALALAMGGLLSGGCAQVAATRSGFLTDYSRLRMPTKEARHLLYRRPELMPDSYKRVVLEPTILRLGSGDAAKISASDASELKAYCDTALRKAVGEGREFVTVPEEKTLRVRAAITGLDTSNVALNAVTGVLLWPVDNGGVSMEIEALDAASAEQLVALVGSSAGTPLQVIGSFSKLGHARSGIDRWTAMLGKLLAHERGAAPSAQH
jgi:hypothetical protein